MNNDGWIAIKPGCAMPEDGEEVLITIWSDDSYGKATNISRTVTTGDYHKDRGYIYAICDNMGGFDTVNDWDEGQPIFVTAWKKMPQAYFEKRIDETTWVFSSYWRGNHDKRIEDATCEKCGCKHPPIVGSDSCQQLIDSFYKYCPNCGRRANFIKEIH